MCELLLLTANEEKLLIARREEANSNWEVGGHNPVFDLAREFTVERINHQDHEQIDM